MATVKVEISRNGPILIREQIDLVDGEGKPLPTTPGKTVALCRCGHSQTKPFCDGQHRKVGFIE